MEESEEGSRPALPPSDRGLEERAALRCAAGRGRLKLHANAATRVLALAVHNAHSEASGMHGMPGKLAMVDTDHEDGHATRMEVARLAEARQIADNRRLWSRRDFELRPL
jgi:hypothetical protein